MTVISEVLTAVLEYLDHFEESVQFTAVNASLLSQNASLILTHTYYARNYAGIIASSQKMVNK